MSGLSYCKEMTGKMGDLVIYKAGWVRFKEVLTPKGRGTGIQIKYKTWKDVWLILRKCGNYSELKSYPDSVKASSFTVEGYPICYEDFCGFEIGEFDGLPHVLAILTRNITYLFTPCDSKDKDEWVDNISQLFEEQSIFYVNVKKNSLIREGQAELRLLSTSVILTGNNLPVCLGKWLISDIRRYGAGREFVFELSQRFEENKKPLIILSTTEAEAIKKLFDEMARSSSVVGHKTHQSVTKSTKSLPYAQKQNLAPSATIPREYQPPQPKPASNKQLNYLTVEFNNDTPPPRIHQISQPRAGDYTAVDITATEALHKAVQQSEHDNKKHAMELAGKLGLKIGVPYENSIMIASQMSRLETEPLCEELTSKLSTDSFAKPYAGKNKRRLSDNVFKSPEPILSIPADRRRYSDESASLFDYENVTIHRNYENVALSGSEQENSAKYST